MNICIIQGAFLPVPPLLGGAVEKMWFELAKQFAKRGHQITYISRQFDTLLNDEFVDGIQHIRVEGYPTPRNGVYLKLLDFLYTRRAIRRVTEDVDIVVTNTFWAPIWLPKHLQRKAYVDVERVPKGQMRLYRRAGRLRANSTPVANAILKELRGESANRVRMIPNPLPFATPTLGLQKRHPSILYCGRVHPEKGLDLLVQAVNSIDGCPPVRVVGPWEISQGGGGAQYLDQLRALDYSNRITFVDPIFDSEKLSQEYAMSSLFVYPSVAEKGETFGLAPLEAMAWGCVPIVSSLDCFRDFIVNDVNGLIFDHRATDAVGQLTSRIKDMLQNSIKHAELAESAVKVCETHSTAIIADQFLVDFELLISENSVGN